MARFIKVNDSYINVEQIASVYVTETQEAGTIVYIHTTDGDVAAKLFGQAADDMIKFLDQEVHNAERATTR